MSFYIYHWYQCEESQIVNKANSLIITFFIFSMSALFVLGLANEDRSQVLLSTYLLLWLVGIGKLREKTNEILIMSPFWLYFFLSSLILTFFNESVLFFIFFKSNENDVSTQTLYLKLLVENFPGFLFLALFIFLIHRHLVLKPSDMFFMGAFGGFLLKFMLGLHDWDTAWLYAGMYMGIYGPIFSFVKPFTLERGNPRKIYLVAIPSIILLAVIGGLMGNFLVNQFFTNEVTKP